MAVSFLSAGYLPRYKRGMNSSLVELSASPHLPPPPQIKVKKLVRNDETGQWHCPFCLQDTFPNLMKVGTPP